MIKNDDDMFMWTGSQGVKMNVAAAASASTTSSGNINLDQRVSYDCKAWTKDVSLFTIPSDVKFVDVAAMLKARGNLRLPN